MLEFWRTNSKNAMAYTIVCTTIAVIVLTISTLLKCNSLQVNLLMALEHSDQCFKTFSPLRISARCLIIETRWVCTCKFAPIRWILQSAVQVSRYTKKWWAQSFTQVAHSPIAFGMLPWKYESDIKVPLKYSAQWNWCNLKVKNVFPNLS